MMSDFICSRSGMAIFDGIPSLLNLFLSLASFEVNGNFNDDEINIYEINFR